MRTSRYQTGALQVGLSSWRRQKRHSMAPWQSWRSSRVTAAELGKLTARSSLLADRAGSSTHTRGWSSADSGGPTGADRRPPTDRHTPQTPTDVRYTTVAAAASNLRAVPTDRPESTTETTDHHQPQTRTTRAPTRVSSRQPTTTGEALDSSTNTRQAVSEQLIFATTPDF